MGKLNYKTSEFDAAIRKVRSDYADVKNVDASAEDVVKGKTFMNAQKELIVGTLEDAEITPSVSIESNLIGEDESDYPVSVTPSVNLSKAGYLSEIEEGTAITKYVKTETKSCTPSKSRQEIKASYGKLMEEVDVGAAEVPAVIDGMCITSFNVTKPTDKTVVGYGAYVPSGSKHNNVYCTADALSSGKAKVYLFRMGETINDLNPLVIVDPETKQIPDTTIVLSPGDSATGTSASYATPGTITLTTEGRVQFTHSSNFYCMYQTGSCILLLYINGYYYIPCVDYKFFRHGSSGVGSYARNAVGFYNGDLKVVRGEVPVNFYKPKLLFANMTNLYFFFFWDKTTNYDPLRMTFNWGSYVGYFVEGEE